MGFLSPSGRFSRRSLSIYLFQNLSFHIEREYIMGDEEHRKFEPGEVEENGRSQNGVVQQKSLIPVSDAKIAEPTRENSSGPSLDKDAVLARVEAEKRLALIKAWEENEKAKADNKAYKKLSSIGAWESSKKTSVETKLKKIEVHISLAGEKYMRVSWITNDKSSSSIVEYGVSLGTYSTTALGESTSYSYLFYKSGMIHHTVIGPLEHDTVYYYRCGGEGPDFQFKTPPAQFPISFAVVGDLGQSGWTKSTIDHIEKCHYDMLLLPGDLSYADYIQFRWDTFGELVQPLASARPWMVTEGNHEREHIPILTDGFESYNARWRMPYEESGSSSNLYYSFEVAGAHIIMLGSYADYDEYSDQYSWLKADLSKVNRTKTPWLLALFHVPWYNSNEAHQGEGNRMMETFEPLLYAAEVDLVLTGHVHAYERSTRINNGRSDPCGAVHITIGDGGNREGLARKYREPQPMSMFPQSTKSSIHQVRRPVK